MLSPPASSNICIWSHKCPERLCVQNLKSLQILTSVRSTLREAKHNRDNVNVKHTQANPLKEQVKTFRHTL